MKRFLFGFLAVLFLILNTIPYLHIMADDTPNDTQLKQLGAFALSSLISSGEATEFDFSDYTDDGTDLLLGIGELIFTGDPSGLVDCGLNWLGDTIDDTYNSFIESIREWEYNVAPDLYNWWYKDTDYEYKLQSVQSIAKPLRRLLTPPDNSPTPQPDPNYNALLNAINGDGFYFKNWENGYFNGNIYYDYYPLYNYSYVSLNNGYGDGNTNYGTISQLTNIISIYIVSAGNDTYSSYIPYTMRGNAFAYSRSSRSIYGRIGPNLTWIAGNQGVNTGDTDSYKDFPASSLYNILSSVASYFRNVNIYVDGVPWSIVSDVSYPVIIPNQLTIWQDEPLAYDFPSDTYVKLPDLTNIITNAINNSGVVMWSDIADCFVDVNGQTAVAVTKIVRNDYDNLYMEQYPYPAMLIGMTDQTKFNEHLLDNSHAYLSPMSTVVQETVSVLPSELVGVLAIGAILTIFAVIINRLLE